MQRKDKKQNAANVKPSWICLDCGEKYNCFTTAHMSQKNDGACTYCGKEKRYKRLEENLRDNYVYRKIPGGRAYIYPMPILVVGTVRIILVHIVTIE